MPIKIVFWKKLGKLCSGLFFEKLNYQVESDADGLQAIDMAKKRFDVILLDIHLPHINGIDVTIKLRQKKNVGNPLIIGITGDMSEDLYKMCLQAGMDEVLYKPADAKQILEIINRNKATK